ncbi:MAG: isoprenylcysteine carboxylmethyltransferase family protein [Chloroflexota bacterium]|nr:isoprenylcysteine carboxylmethyltransferase family protein [Chloroflexota bacterium]
MSFTLLTEKFHINGWGSLIFWAFMLAWVLSELFVGKLGLNMGALHSDQGSAAIVVLGGLGGIAVGSFMAALEWLPLDRRSLWLGLATMSAGLALRIFSILYLGPMFTRFVQIVPGHRLVTSGPYRLVRHPSYSGLLLFFVGVGITLGDWLALPALVILPLAAILYRVHVEEQALLSAFGSEYRGYMKRVRALVPYLY